MNNNNIIVIGNINIVNYYGVIIPVIIICLKKVYENEKGAFPTG